MDDINTEIEQVAQDLKKSTQTPHERLRETILAIGPEGIRSKLPTLEKSEKELLVEVLKGMVEKAVEMDDVYAAKFVQGNIKDTKLQEDKADDDQDEKMVKEEAAKMNHQGQPTPGWEGQVIKAKNSDKDEKKEKKMGAKIQDAVDEIAENEAKEEVEEHEDKMHKKGKMKKAEDMEKKQGVPKGVDPSKQERCVRKLKGEPGKNPYAICNASMKKGESITDEVRAALGEIRKSVEEQLKEFGVDATPALVKAEMKRLLQEEDQDGDAPKMDEKTRANKPNVDALNLGKDNEEAQKKVDAKAPMKKAVWSGENDLLKAMTGGRNHHFSLEEYVAAVIKESAQPQEALKKSEGESKDDLNEIIAKSQDADWDHVNTERQLEENKSKIRGKLVKSFEDDEIAQALGLSPEEAKQILGEK